MHEYGKGLGQSVRSFWDTASQNRAKNLGVIALSCVSSQMADYSDFITASLTLTSVLLFSVVLGLGTGVLGLR